MSRRKRPSAQNARTNSKGCLPLIGLGAGVVFLLSVCVGVINGIAPGTIRVATRAPTHDTAAVSTDTTARLYATLTAEAQARADLVVQPSPTSASSLQGSTVEPTITRHAPLKSSPTANAISEGFVTSTPEGIFGVAAIELIIRNGPGTTYKQIGVLQKGERVRLVAMSSDRYWAQHVKGWSAAKYLQVAGDEAQLEIAQNIPTPPGAATGQPTVKPPAQAAPPPTVRPVQPAASSGHQYVASSRAKKYYYCDNDPQWHSLSPKYLVWSSDPSIFQRQGLVLHRPC